MLLIFEQEETQQMGELEQCDTRYLALEAELRLGNQRKEQLQSELQQKIEQHKTASSELAEQKKQLNSLDAERLGVVSRLRSLNEIADKCEWSESGVSDILLSEHKSLVKGVVAEIIRVKPGYEDAVERYLAHLLDAAIVTNSDDLAALARFIKQRQLPKTAFFMLDGKATQKLAKPIGLKCLADVVTIDEAFQPLFHQLEQFFIAENLTTAIHHWPAAQLAQATIISEQGELLLPDGRALILGNDNGKGVLKRKNEINELKAKLVLLETAKKTLHETVLRSEADEKACELVMAALRQETNTHSYGLVRLEESVKQKAAERTRILAERDKLHTKMAELAKKSGLFDERIAELSKSWAAALDEHKEQEDVLERLRAEKASVDEDFNSYQQKLHDIEVQKIAAHEKVLRFAHSLSEAEKNLTQTQTQINALTSQANEKGHDELVLKETIRQNEKKLSDLTCEIEATGKMLVEKKRRCGELARAKESEELKLHQLTAREQELRKKLHQFELELNTIDHQLLSTEERIKEKYRVNLRDYIVDFHHIPLDEQAATAEKNDLTKTKDRLGSVNENAAREYEEFKERSEFLHTQVADLNDALTQLEDAIKKINKTTKLRFMEAFNNINEQFSKVFPRLFNGGRAELVLCGEEDLQTSGIDIIAKPPGKNISSIELMSGGEKALTAISLIMAIFLIKPSPFCLLDEVDAPLDEANVARFSQLIKEMSQFSQFIVITHNRKTMESADKLYGVTMEDAGLSKIVSVHVQQAFEALKTPMPRPVKKVVAPVDENLPLL